MDTRCCWPRPYVDPARFAGICYRRVTAFAQFATLLNQGQLKAVGAFWSESKQRYTASSITTLRNRLACGKRRTKGQPTLLVCRPDSAVPVSALNVFP